MQFEDAQLFNNGMALVRKDNKSYFVNRQGKKVKELEDPEEHERNEMKARRK